LWVCLGLLTVTKYIYLSLIAVFDPFSFYLQMESLDLSKNNLGAVGVDSLLPSLHLVEKSTFVDCGVGRKEEEEINETLKKRGLTVGNPPPINTWY